ncbi:hypothetical protein BX661DRAFT_199260 [Kickxella alabastrina]|uniref:uncharacterized protein n=1 Tax=Kickxella alabastrina TaxID=61397 RepID=UPI00221F201A|nr:uncharacterized protein BX661DRAFT_199260 [Kickxella alabastrina]KAI7825411.1 hypothetical protein BX661DRAFT_199260 [Kickxella alabastrina]
MSNHQQPSPRSYIAVNDKTPLMRVLYVSPNIQEHFGRMINRNIQVTNMVVDARGGTPVYLRMLHFTCDALEFSVALRYPDLAALPSIVAQPTAAAKKEAEGEAEAVARERELDARLVEKTPTRQYSGSSTGMHTSVVGAYARQQACLVLERYEGFVDGSGGGSPMGARIVFASNSFGRTLNMDSSDIQGRAFLELVDPEDVVRAARFLDCVSRSISVESEHLRFMDGDAGGSVLVEVLAAGSHDGAILLCQTDSAMCGRHAAAAASGNSSAINEFEDSVSLGDIISSEPRHPMSRTGGNRCP